MDNMKVKIYKSATKVSIMDINDALNYHKENRKNEKVYRGNLEIVINEYGTTKNQETAYLSKAGAKVLFYSIANHHFPKIYVNGFEEYGGGMNKKGEIRSRVFSVLYEPDKRRFKFQIDEGPGRKENSGSIKMIKREKSVRTYVAYDEALKMSHEVLDFIKQAENTAMINGNPYYTLVPDLRKRNQNNDDMINEGFMENPTENDIPSQPYIIKIGTLAGKSIDSLDTNSLEALVAKINPDSIELSELLDEIKKELARRY